MFFSAPPAQLIQCSYTAQELPTSLGNLLPRTHEYLSSGPNIIDTGSSTIWNTDGTGSGQDDWAMRNRSYQPHYDIRPPTWDRPPLLERQPQPDRAATEFLPYALPSLEQYAPPFEHFLSRRASSIAPSPALIHHHGQHPQMPAVQQWRTDNLEGMSNLMYRISPLRIALMLAS